MLSTLNLCLLFPREVAKPQALPHHLLNSMNIVMAMLIVFVTYSTCLSTTYQKIKKIKNCLNTDHILPLLCTLENHEPYKFTEYINITHDAAGFCITSWLFCFLKNEIHKPKSCKFETSFSIYVM